MKFLPLNVDFDGPNIDFLSSRKTAHESIKERYPRKVVILPLMANFSSKRLQIHVGMGMYATYHNKH